MVNLKDVNMGDYLRISGNLRRRATAYGHSTLITSRSSIIVQIEQMWAQKPPIYDVIYRRLDVPGAGYTCFHPHLAISPMFTTVIHWSVEGDDIERVDRETARAYMFDRLLYLHHHPTWYSERYEQLVSSVTGTY